MELITELSRSESNLVVSAYLDNQAEFTREGFRRICATCATMGKGEVQLITDHRSYEAVSKALAATELSKAIKEQSVAADGLSVTIMFEFDFDVHPSSLTNTYQSYFDMKEPILVYNDAKR